MIELSIRSCIVNFKWVDNVKIYKAMFSFKDNKGDIKNISSLFESCSLDYSGIWNAVCLN